MDSSKNRRMTSSFKKYSRLRINLEKKHVIVIVKFENLSKLFVWKNNIYVLIWILLWNL